MILTDEPFFWALLSAHLLGDFYFQSQEMAEKKKTEGGMVVRHSLLYAVFVLAAAFLFGGEEALCVGAMAAIGHFAVDMLKFFLEDRGLLSRCCQGWILLGDQLIHISILILLSVAVSVEIRPELFIWLERLGWPYSLSGLLRLCCLGLFLGKPANVVLKLCNQKPESTSKEGREKNPGKDEGEEEPPARERDRRAGAIIGTLERMLTAVVFLLGSYGTIGVIFAAKTLTRYQKIVGEPEFSEYYLIGTLGSMLLSIFAVVLLFPPG